MKPKTYNLKLTLAITLAMLFGTANMQAATYDLWICGVQVTDANKGNLTVINGTNGCTVTGTVNYNSESKTLTLNNANITIPDGANAIRSAIEGLTVNVQNNNTVNSDGYATVRFENSATINGYGTLNVSQTSGGWALFAYGNSLTIENCTVNATSNGRGITCNSGNVCTLIINNATVTATGTGDGSITHFANIILNGSTITEPAEAVISKGAETFYAVRNSTSGAVVTDLVKIVAPTYDLKICNVRVTDANKGNLTAAVNNAGNGSTVTGTVTYNSTTNTLMLSNATITDLSDFRAIYSKINGLKIELVGTNTISGSFYTIEFAGSGSTNNTTITGNGTLNVSCPSGEAIYVYKNALTIKGCTVNTNGDRGFRGLYASLSLEGANVTAIGSQKGLISGFYNGITLKGCSFISPADAQIINGEVCGADGNVIKGEVKIGISKYDLWICGTQVTGANMDDLSVINGVTGTVSYNSDSKTLTLNNANITIPNGANAIRSSIEGLIVNVQNNNTVNSDDYATVRFEKSATINGYGTLNVSQTSGGWALFTYGSSLTIENCTVNATSNGRGITCNNENVCTLIINNATVTSKGNVDGSITHFANIILNGSTITEPAEAVISKGAETFYAVRNSTSGAVVTDMVKIVPAYDLWICGKQVTSVNKDDLTVINGYDGCTVSGGVSYNPDTRTLTLNGATINRTSSNTIVCYDGGVNIELIGDNTVTSSDNAIVFSDLNGQAPGSIYGSGTLNATSTNGIAIFSLVPLTIKNCTVNAVSGNFGLFSNNKKLTIDSATLSATGTNYGSIVGFSELSLLNCIIAQPLNAVYDTNQKAIVVDGNIVKTQVKIEPEIPYNLWIWGTQVTSINCSDLAAIIGATEGSISYDPATTTLTLDNVKTDNSGDKNTIKSSIEGLKINIVGSNTLKADGWSLIDVSSNSTIEGSGTLNIENTRDDYYYCINVQNSATLTIKNCNLNLTSPKRCIIGYLNEKLIIDNATVSAANNDFNYKLVAGFNTINLINCFISEPAGAKINNGSIDVGVSKFLKIIPGTAYDLWVGGVRVTPDNKDDLSVIPAVTGTVSYNPDTQILLLDNATINSGIISEIDELIIELTGISKIIANNDGILSYKPFTIQGRGTLNVNSNTGVAIWANGTSLTVKNCILNLVGATYGIFGDNAGLATLTIDNADVSALSHVIDEGRGAIVGFNAINTTDCNIIEPSGAVFNPDKKAICYADGTIVSGKYNPVKIAATSYNLWIGGTQVTNNNKADFTAGVTQGTVSYNSDTKTLTLTNATIDATTGNNKGILSAIDELTIELVGNNTVKSGNNTGIYLENPATISGSGTLNVTATGTDQTAIYIYKTWLKINNCTVEAAGNGYGIRGFNGSVEALRINNATVTAQGAGAGSITHFNIIAFSGIIDITEPLDAEIRWGADAAYAVRDKASQAIITDKVKIGHIPTFIKDGNWNEPANWSTGTVPGATQKVVILGTAKITEDIEVAEFKIYSGYYIIVNPGKKLTVTRKSINDGTIFLLSNATNGTATLVGDVSGQAEVHQAAVNYRTYYLSSPVSGTVTTSANMGNYITFTETTDQWTSPAPFANINPVAGKGYGVQVGVNVAESERGKATTFNFTGTLNNGEVKIPITSGNKQFNFVGNPYPSYLNTIKVVANPNITKSLWFYSKLADNTPYQFTAYNVPTGLSIPDEGHDYGYIPLMQGFWVKANADVDYTFSNEMRVHKPAGSPAIFRAPQAKERQLLRLQLSNGTIKDETAILFSEEATNEWNTPKMMDQKLCIYTLKDGENLALNSSKAINYDVEIPVGVKVESGVYTFSASKLENFGTEKVFLLDKVANTVTNLSNNDIHTVNFAEAYEGTDRFALVFPRSGVITGWDGATQTEFFAFAKDKRIIVSTDAQSGTIYVYNSVGQQVASKAISGKLTTVSTVLSEGVYVVKLNNRTTKVVVK
ncbi:MAG TPA: hypothetical protein GXZ87_08225 [Bacteroidales bacterium]|nr:hypothetical protein [Bacteroidales bacterium]